MSNGNNQGTPQYVVDSSPSGGGGQWLNWLKDNASIIIAIIIIVVLAGSILFYTQNEQTEQTEVGQDANTSIDLPEQSTDTEQTEEVKSTDQLAETEVEEPDDLVEVPLVESVDTIGGGPILETAVKGEGLTHLARRALARYLFDNPVRGIASEHKIFIEDYMVKKLGSGLLEVGEIKEFSISLIADAITQAQGLAEAEIDNLSQYALLVPGL